MPHIHQRVVTSEGMSSHEHPPQPVEHITDNLEVPALDDRAYRVIRLPNKLEALLVHDGETDKASAAIDVNVGSYSDERDMPGMAHAVEHLLFMGTKKYPRENDYNQYLSAHSGDSNAYTGATSTNYYFEIGARPSNEEEPTAENPSPLKEALDRFAQFFIEPLFLASTLDRELQAVDSENKKNLQSDSWRLRQLEKSLSNPKHPYSTFGTGNLEVLKIQPEARGVSVRQKFIEFYDKHYSANRMKLVVLGREPLDVLEAWVLEYFSLIQNKDLKQNRWEESVPLGPEQLCMQSFAKPVMDSRSIELSWAFLDEYDMYETQPSRYLSHLIGHEGPGSIMSYIKSKGWANGLSAGGYGTCPGSPGMFEVTIRLTQEGLKNYKEIVMIVFQYISMLKETPPLEWIFQEQKGLADVDFKFRQKTPASRFTSKISAEMQKPLPREWLLSGESRLRRFDPVLIQKGVECLQSDNFRLAVVSRDFPGKWESKEFWYGTEYTYEAIPTDFLADVRKAASSTAVERSPNLHLPHKNQFIPTNLEVEKREVKKPAVAPKLIRNDAVARTWYKKDDQFWTPKADVQISCRTPIIFATAENSVKARLFAGLVKDALEEYSYDADLAGLEYGVSLDDQGLEIEVSGYNDKLTVLLQQVLVTMRDLEVKDDRFDIVKERLTRGYQNWGYQQPYHQVGNYTSCLITQDDHVVEELIAELPSVTAVAIRAFAKDMLAQMHLDIFVHGNMYKEEVLKLTDLIVSTLKPRPLPRSQWPILRSLVFPPGSNYVYKKTLGDPANVNHCIEYWLCTGDKGDHSVRAKTFLLDQILHEPAFDQLRTKEQLGYVVFAGSRSSDTTFGFRFLIQSEKTPQFLETRIENFLTQYFTTLKAMTQTEFESHQRSLTTRLLEKMKNLGQETGRIWTQISGGYYDFERAQHNAQYVKKLTLQDMIDFYAEYLLPSSKQRAKLAIWMLAQATSDVSTNQITQLVAALELTGEQAAQAATDLQARLSAGEHDQAKEVDELKTYLSKDLQVSEDKIKTAVESWKAISRKPNGLEGVQKVDETPPALNGSKVCFIDDVWEFKSGLAATAGPKPIKDLAEFEELEPKL